MKLYVLLKSDILKSPHYEITIVTSNDRFKGELLQSFTITDIENSCYCDYYTEEEKSIILNSEVRELRAAGDREIIIELISDIEIK